MSICTNFEGGLMKALRSLEQHVDSLMHGDFDKLWTYHLESLLFEYLRGYPDAEQQIQGLKDAYNLQLGFDNDRNDG